MWPQKPENLSALTDEALEAFAEQVRQIAPGVLREGTAEERTEAREYVALRGLALETLADRAAAAALEAAEVTPEPEPEVVPDPELTPEPEAAVVDVPALAGVGVPATVTTAPPAPPQRPSFGWVATDETPGKDIDSPFESWEELGEAIATTARGLSVGSDKKHEIARLPGNFNEFQRLSDDKMRNLTRFQPEEITAALCAPITPLYDLACRTTTRRPVRDSLPTFMTPTRGGFSVYPSPTLDDITGGYGQWTADDDADPEAIKEACQTIDCATPVDYLIYGVYRCLTVKNLLNMTFPELVEAYLNRLASAQARLAETLLLEAMGNGADAIDAVSLGYGATTTVLSTVLNYIGLYQEQQRWDIDGTLEAWAPRHLLTGIQMDFVRRRRTDGSFSLVPSESTVNGWFRDAGVDIHWFIDRPSWATTIPPVATNGVLNFMPRHVEILIAPRGKFAFMDRGNLTVGVSPNNIYRLNDDLRRNQFTFFFESFEGVIDTNTCPAHLIQIPNLCYNGQQIADLVINCEGADEVGAAS
jgi:hypothetical protein